MIPKVHKGGKNLSGALSYVMKKDQDPHIIGGTVQGSNRKDLMQNFAPSNQLAESDSRLKNHVWHASISYQQEDMQNGLTPEQRAEIASKYVEHQLQKDWEIEASQYRKKYGDDFSEDKLPPRDPNMFQWAVVSHGQADDKQNPHDHIIMVRRGLDGSTYGNRLSGRVSQEWARSIEQEYGLARIPGRDQQQSRKQAHPVNDRSYQEHAKGNDHPDSEAAKDVREAIDGLGRGEHSYEDLAQALENKGYSLHREETKSGRERFYIHGPEDKGGIRKRADRLGLNLSNDLKKQARELEQQRLQERDTEAEEADKKESNVKTKKRGGPSRER